MLLEEVVVTAQKREQNVNEIGMAISAFSGEDLKALGVMDTRDLTNLVPGFTVANSDLNTPIYTLRGVGFNTPNLSSASPVGVYVDEASFPYPYMGNGLIHDLERVEVLKGPQGTLYGRNTTGGLVNFITNRPTDEFEASITARVGNYESYGIDGFVQWSNQRFMGCSSRFQHAQRPIKVGKKAFLAPATEMAKRIACLAACYSILIRATGSART